MRRKALSPAQAAAMRKVIFILSTPTINAMRAKHDPTYADQHFLEKAGGAYEDHPAADSGHGMVVPVIPEGRTGDDGVGLVLELRRGIG